MTWKSGGVNAVTGTAAATSVQHVMNSTMFILIILISDMIKLLSGFAVHQTQQTTPQTKAMQVRNDCSALKQPVSNLGLLYGQHEMFAKPHMDRMA